MAREVRTSRSTLTGDLMPDLGDVTMDERIEILLGAYLRGGIDWKVMGLNLLRCFEVEPDHPRAPAVVRRVLDDFGREIGRTHRMTLEAHSVLAGVQAARGEDEAAEHTYRTALRLAGEDDEAAGRLREPFFVFLARRDRLAEARALLGRPADAVDRGRLAQLLEAADLPDEAVAEYRGALGAAEEALGPDHGTTMNLRTLLAMLATRIGHPDAEEAQRGVVADLERNAGPDSPSTLVARSNLASLVRERGRLDEAADLFREVVDDHRRVLGTDHPGTVITTANYGNLLYEVDRDREAERLFRALLPMAARVLGPDHPVTRRARQVAAAPPTPAAVPRPAPARDPGETQP